MHDDPRTDASDPGDLTERHAIPAYEPAATATDPGATTPEPTGPTDAESLPTEPSAPGSAAPFDPITPARVEAYDAPGHYTPVSEPRADWARSWDDTVPVTPERWYEPAPTTAPVQAATADRPRVGGIILAAVLAALLASGGTVLALGAAGALDRPAAPAQTT
ncbi:MAG TPA: hypothetical protein VIM25_01200, partial [Candidatus Limnocylindrales bacterium]